MRLRWGVPLPGPFSVGGSVGGSGCATFFGWLLAASVVFALLAWPYEAVGRGAGAWLAEIGWQAFLAAGVVAARAVYVHGRQERKGQAVTAPQERPGDVSAQIQRTVAAGQAASDAVKAMAAAQATGDVSHGRAAQTCSGLGKTTPRVILLHTDCAARRVRWRRPAH
jgi:hypothetical protein